MPVNKQRGERIKQLMKKNELTREDLASVTGYSLSLITKARNGEEFKTDFQFALCQVLKTTPDYLNGYTPQSSEIAEVLIELERVNDPQVSQAILALLKRY